MNIDRQALRLLVVASWIAGASSILQGATRILNPTTYFSQSGDYSLSVDPSDLFGRGPGEYRFRHLGETIWTGQLPYTLWNAGIADSGRVIGYAYTHGLEGFPMDRSIEGDGDFIVVVLSSSGEVTMQEIHQREPSRFFHSLPNPVGEGITLNELANQAVIRISDPDLNRRMEQWWAYDLVGGRRISTFEPAGQVESNNGRLSIIATRPLASTGLSLVHWWRVGRSREIGALYSLVDQSGASVWELRLPDDYLHPEDEEKQAEIRRQIWKHGGILRVGEDGAFDLHLVKDGIRASFATRKNADGVFEVTETDRAPYSWPNGSSALPSVPEIIVEELTTVSLSRSAMDDSSDLRDLIGFDFGNDGDICVIQAGQRTVPSLLLVDAKGEILQRVAVPMDSPLEQVRFSNPTHVGDRKFVFAVSEIGIGATARLFLSDLDAGKLIRIGDEECPSVEALAGFDDGRFVALTLRRSKYTMNSGLVLFDSSGKQVWNTQQDGFAGRADELVSPDDISTYGTNRIAVLDNVRSTVQLFNDRGRLERTIDLKESWGRSPNYPVNIATDANDGYLIYDFDAEHPLVRMGHDGKILSEWTPRFADGRPIGIAGGVERSPQGALWVGDRESLFRLGADGVVDLVLGRDPRPDVLSSPGYSSIGPHGRIYVADRRSSTLHVFDKFGKRLGRCVPHPEDLSETSDVIHIAVSANGRIYISLDIVDERYLEFSRDFERLGWGEVENDSVKSEWYFQPTGELCWVVGYHDVVLLNGLREPIRRLGRRADGRWLEFPGPAAVAPDGSLAIAARTESGEHSITVFSSMGDPTTTFSIPVRDYVASLSFNGQRIIVSDFSDTWMFGVDGDLMGKLRLPSEIEVTPWTALHTGADGREISIIAAEAFEVRNFSLPEPD